jgi:hypothetical protein
MAVAQPRLQAVPQVNRRHAASEATHVPCASSACACCGPQAHGHKHAVLGENFLLEPMLGLTALQVRPRWPCLVTSHAIVVGLRCACVLRVPTLNGIELVHTRRATAELQSAAEHNVVYHPC